jgi:hypothetical protein
MFSEIESVFNCLVNDFCEDIIHFKNIFIKHFFPIDFDLKFYVKYIAYYRILKSLTMDEYHNYKNPNMWKDYHLKLDTLIWK